MSPLRQAVQLLLRRGSEAIAPPGSDAGLALLVALAGLLVGLAMPTQIAMVELWRVLGTSGPAALISALQAFPRPSPQLVAVAAGLALTVVGFSGGWINAALALAREEEVAATAWADGLRRTWRILGWNVVLVAWLALIGLLGGEVGYMAIRSGLSASRVGEIVMPSLMGIAGLALWAFTLGAAVCYLAVSSLGAIVAVAEPETSFWRLFSRAPRLFMAGAGWRGVQEIVLLLLGWWAFKAGCGQLLVPFWEPAYGFQSLAFGLAGAIFQAGLALGDGLVLVLAVQAGAIVYVEATRKLDKAPAAERPGRLKPWLLLPGKRSAGPR